MTKFLIALLCALTVYSFTSRAHAAPSVAEQKTQLAKWQAGLDDKTVTENTWTKEMCSKEIPAKLDLSLAAPFMEAGNDATYYCREVREKLSTICRNAKTYLKEGNKKDNKALVGSMINKITCTHSKGAEDDASFALKGGELTVSLGAKSSNISEKLYAFLTKTQGFNPGNP